ncbi:hypothetical protein NL520_27725, partial [Klebsiella pneumoniae]|nr:hypothetical protein [Klebsiella pneumoniae]
PYLERGYVVARQVGEEKLRSELYAALREDDADRAYMQDFVQTVRDSSFATLPGLSRLEA